MASLQNVRPDRKFDAPSTTVARHLPVFTPLEQHVRLDRSLVLIADGSVAAGEC
jgi:hypothetical protein